MKRSNVFSKIFYNCTIVIFFWFNCCGRNKKIVMTNYINFITQCFIPSGTYIHVIIQIKQVRSIGQSAAIVKCITNANIFFAETKINIGLFFYPFFCAVFSFINMYNNLMFKKGILPDAVDTKFQIIKVVPCRNEYGKFSIFYIAFFFAVKVCISNHILLL